MCNLPTEPDYSSVQCIDHPQQVIDFNQALRLADQEAEKLLNDYMLLSFYDADKDFESPPHAGECHINSAIPGYIDYALYRGANLKITFEKGRFVFFYLKV